MKNSILVVAIAVLSLFSTAHATTWYVHPDSALNSIQAGIDLCATGDTVLVGAGTYTENINFNGMAIAVTSEYGHDTTIIDGSSPAHPDTGSVVLFISGENANSVLQGFTITGGTGTVDPVSGVLGGGILCSNNSSPTINNNTITSNAAYFGGGIDCVYNSSPLITNNTISANNAAGSGGGIDLYDNSSPTITSNVINGNNTGSSGAGIQCFNNCSPLISDNTITNNIAGTLGGGIRVADNSSPVIGDNQITGNQSFGGGAIICQGSNTSPHIYHNTISNNIAPVGAGIECGSYASPTIERCLISYNEDGDEIYCSGGATPVIYYNDLIDTASGGYLVFNADSFVTIDADSNWWGHSSGPYHPTANPGGQGGAVSDDVDFDPWLQGPGITELNPSVPVRLALQVSPNPFRNFTRIRYSILDTRYLIENTTLRIFDATGRLVRQWDDPTTKLSDHVIWDGTDEFNRQLASGVYFVKFTADGSSTARKVLLIR